MKRIAPLPSDTASTRVLPYQPSPTIAALIGGGPLCREQPGPSLSRVWIETSINQAYNGRETTLLTTPPSVSTAMMKPPTGEGPGPVCPLSLVLCVAPGASALSVTV